MELREKIAEEIFCTVNPSRTISFRQFIEKNGKVGDLYYKATDHILALIKESSWINIDDYEVVFRKLDSPDVKELLKKEGYVKLAKNREGVDGS